MAETWGALERLVDDGRCRAIGLSDVTLEKLREIVAVARIKPAVVQVESHPYLPEWELLDFCREHGIVLLAFAALGHAMEPRVIDEPVITAIAQRLHKSPAQVVLSWAAQRGTAFLTTSTKPQRIQENCEISVLPEDAMKEIRDHITANVRFNAVVDKRFSDSSPGRGEMNSQAVANELVGSPGHTDSGGRNTNSDDMLVRHRLWRAQQERGEGGRVWRQRVLIVAPLAMEA